MLELNVGVAMVLVASVSQELSSRAMGQWASWGGRRQLPSIIMSIAVEPTLVLCPDLDFTDFKIPSVVRCLHVLERKPCLL